MDSVERVGRPPAPEILVTLSRRLLPRQPTSTSVGEVPGLGSRQPETPTVRSNFTDVCSLISATETPVTCAIVTRSLIARSCSVHLAANDPPMRRCRVVEEDADTAQARELLQSLYAHVDEISDKLEAAEQKTVRAQGRRENLVRREAASLRRELYETHRLIDGLHRRFPITSPERRWHNHAPRPMGTGRHPAR